LQGGRESILSRHEFRAERPDLPRRRRRDGRADARARLVGHAPGQPRPLAAIAAHRGAADPELRPSDVHLVGPRAPLLLQRRLPPIDRPGAAPFLARPAGPRRVGGDLAHHRPADRTGDVGSGRHLERKPPRADHAERPPRGRLLDLQLQSDRRGRRAARRGRRTGRLQRNHAEGADRAAAHGRNRAPAPHVPEGTRLHRRAERPPPRLRVCERSLRRHRRPARLRRPERARGTAGTRRPGLLRTARPGVPQRRAIHRPGHAHSPHRRCQHALHRLRLRADARRGRRRLRHLRRRPRHHRPQAGRAAVPLERGIAPADHRGGGDRHLGRRFYHRHIDVVTAHQGDVRFLARRGLHARRLLPRPSSRGSGRHDAGVRRRPRFRRPLDLRRAVPNGRPRRRRGPLDRGQGEGPVRCGRQVLPRCRHRHRHQRAQARRGAPRLHARAQRRAARQRYRQGVGRSLRPDGALLRRQPRRLRPPRSGRGRVRLFGVLDRWSRPTASRPRPCPCLRRQDREEARCRRDRRGG